MRKLNFSKKRDAVLSVLRSTNVHPTAEWIYNRLKTEYPDFSLGTVYRNLSLFKEQGLVVTVATVNGQERYDGVVTAHAHFVCNNCGSIADINCLNDSSGLDERIERLYDCKVDRHSLCFYGVCSNCKHESSAEKAPLNDASV